MQKEAERPEARDIPDESSGAVTTDAILKGLRLSGPALGAPKQLGPAGQNHDDDQPHHQMIAAPVSPDCIRNDRIASISQPSFDSRSTSCPRPTASPSLQPPSPSEFNFNLKMDMPQQTVQLSPQTSTSEPHYMMARLELGPEMSLHESYGFDSYPDVDAFLDTSSCTIPTGTTSENFAAATRWDTASTRPPFSQDQPRQHWAVRDSYLGPWAGSLAATYNRCLQYN
ncbi:hypothetical protein H2202_011165 [Exophiala xenobiotica]|nr:hypothetical protein H2202_011165 [Exophiala xenobiotica]